MAQPPIFACSPPPKALVALILIENSHTIFPYWNDLRQHYLPTLLGTIRIANPLIPIPVLWLTTTPVGDDPASLHSPSPRQYNQLPELKFCFTSDNRISARIINRATELMVEAATQFRDGPVSFHLFVVAASPPMHGTWALSPTMPVQTGQSEWRLLGQRIAQFGIHCHMILPGSQDMSPLNEVFSTSLQLQGHTQVPPWFQIASDYTFLLSGNLSDSLPIEAADTTRSDPLQQPLLPVARPPVLRHQSFPQDVQSAAAPSPQNGSAPSLVTSLQKVHGLSRKKLYGTQPPRQPFVREEPVRTKYKSTPTPLSIQVGSQPSSIPEDGRALAKSKIERGRRADRHVGDPSNSCSPSRRSPWTHIASSDITPIPSSPTNSLSSHQTTSPTVPHYPDIAGYPTNPSATSAVFTTGVVSSAPIPESNFSSTLCDPSIAYLPISPGYQSPVIPVSSQGSSWPPTSKSSSNTVSVAKSSATLTSHRRRSQEIPMQSLGAISTKYRLDSEPRPPKSAQRVKDAGDMPFIFSPELEAATAAKLKAALQSTSPVSSFSAFTSGQMNYAGTEDAYPSPSTSVSTTTAALAPPSYDPMPDARPTGLVDGHAIDNIAADGEPPAHFVASTSSSSLQGWAG